MKPGVVRFLHTHERVQVAKALGLAEAEQAAAASPSVYGYVYATMEDAQQYAASNIEAGHKVYGPGVWDGRPVSLLIPGMPRRAG